MSENPALMKLNELIEKLFQIHPGDKTRVSIVAKEIAMIVDQLLSDDVDEIMEMEIGKLLDRLKKTHFQVFNDVVSRSRYGMKINDLIQKVHWRNLQRRLSGSRS